MQAFQTGIEKERDGSTRGERVQKERERGGEAADGKGGDVEAWGEK